MKAGILELAYCLLFTSIYLDRSYSYYILYIFQSLLNLRGARKVRSSFSLIIHHRHLTVDHTLIGIREYTVIFKEKRTMEKEIEIFFGSVIDSSQNALTLRV